MIKSMLAGAVTASVIICVIGSATAALAQNPKPGRPKMDLAFCIDTTGSMGSEIDTVKAKVKELVAKLSAGKPAPEVRVGLVAYRDRGDAYVTRTFPFTDDIDRVVKDISSLQAQGGGDGPESVNEALHVAVHDLKWDECKRTAKLLFLIGDAGPHFYPGDFDWRKESQQAISQGIQINTIGCAGLESYPQAQGVDVFKQIAKLTDGKYDTLAYRQEVATADGSKDTYITSGGAVYKMKAGDREAWRAGMARLEAKGLADRLHSSPAAAPAMAASAMARARAVSGSAREALAEEAAPGVAPSRRDNNLADVLLDGAQAAARKTLKVEFGR